ncbi:hypothetical protein NPI25_002741, partial [Providencia stuartii]
WILRAVRTVAASRLFFIQIMQSAISSLTKKVIHRLKGVLPTENVDGVTFSMMLFSSFDELTILFYE